MNKTIITLCCTLCLLGLQSTTFARTHTYFSPGFLSTSSFSPGSEGLRQILFGTPKRTSGDPEGKSSARIQKDYHTKQQGDATIKYRTIYVTPHVAKLDINGQDIVLKHPPLMVKGTAYVPLREMVEILKQYGIRASVDYLGHNNVSLKLAPVQAKPNTFDYYFGAGLMDMWRGDVAEAITQFRKAEKFGGDEARDAKGMADWLEEEDNSAIIRFHWWNLPEDITVFVDGKEIERGAILAAVTTGDHELRILGKNETEIYNQTIKVHRGRAFKVEITVHTKE